MSQRSSLKSLQIFPDMNIHVGKLRQIKISHFGYRDIYLCPKFSMFVSCKFVISPTKSINKSLHIHQARYLQVLVLVHMHQFLSFSLLLPFRVVIIHRWRLLFPRYLYQYTQFFNCNTCSIRYHVPLFCLSQFFLCFFNLYRSLSPPLPLPLSQCQRMQIHKKKILEEKEKQSYDYLY